MSILNDNPQQRAPKPGKLKWLPEEVRSVKINAVQPARAAQSAFAPPILARSRPFSLKFPRPPYIRGNPQLAHANFRPRGP